MSDYYLIKGTFHVVGYSPDGDSLMFKASSPKQWDKVQTEHRDEFMKKLDAGNGAVQLRLQGIDALETHYSASPMRPPSHLSGKESDKAEKPSIQQVRQPKPLGNLSTETMLSHLGVKGVNYGSFFGRHWIDEMWVKKGTRTLHFTEKGEDELEGYIIVNDMDRKGRPIAWVYGGRTRTRNGTRLTPARFKGRVKASVNYKLLAEGLVYPYYFMTLSAAVRDILSEAVEAAQQEKLNLWKADRTMKGVTIRRLSQLTDKDVMYPYLFRRLVKHQYQKEMEAYWDALEKNKSFTPDPEKLHLDRFFEDSNPYVFLIKERDFVRLDEVVYATKTKLKLRTHPGNLVFLG